MAIRSYEDIEAYRRSKLLYPIVVECVRCFPTYMRHLGDQLCRSANSIHANIAEGFGRSPAEFRMYLQRALGSCNETKSHIEDAIHVGVIDQQRGEEMLEDYRTTSKLIYRLREKWQ